MKDFEKIETTNEKMRLQNPNLIIQEGPLYTLQETKTDLLSLPKRQD